ncbi:hypothetical protein BJ878DRAFT_97565 [Calycina marina]|uniref:DUF3295 domain-containing protein n=1 Tax=Calycina marina TaxID=1763456 RepID=A0A9P8CEB8_9HELO|nr:hypothetical protein BJ878DRAFT_97565 [Calycina marina]
MGCSDHKPINKPIKSIDYGGKTKVNPEPTIEEPAQSQVIAYGTHLIWELLRNQPHQKPVDGTDDKDVDESAISDDWEDSDESESESESESPSFNDKNFFHQVETPPNLNARRSLITTILYQSDGAAFALQSTPALTVSSNGPSLAASPDSDGGLFPG